MASADVPQPGPAGVPNFPTQGHARPWPGRGREGSECGGGASDPRTPHPAGSGAAARLLGRSRLAVLLFFLPFPLPRRALLCVPRGRGLLCSQMGSGWRDGVGGGGAAASPGPDRHHRTLSLSPASSHLVSPRACPILSPVHTPPPPPPSAHLTHPHCPSSPQAPPSPPAPPHCPVGPREMAEQGSWGALRGCWVPRGGLCPRLGGSGCSPPLPSPCRCRAAQMRSG